MAESLLITKHLRLSHLRTNTHQDRRNASCSAKPVYGIDTETDQNGDILLICDSDGRYLDKITPDSVIQWLFCKKYQGTWNFFYNISFDAEVILKLLGSNLNIYKNTRKLKFQWNDYTLEYIPAKKLAIRKDHHSVVFFDIAQYYHTSLVNAYQSNIKPLPESYLNAKSNRDSFSKNYYRRHKTLVRNYCIMDCKLTKELSKHWIKLFSDAFSFLSQRWISSGYLAEKVMINNNIPIPRFSDISYDVQDMAWKSYYGGRFEILKRGFIGNAYLYDINSAYPYAFSKIPDITKGKWIKRKSINPESLLGFFHIECDIPDEKYIPPFPFKNNKLIFPEFYSDINLNY